MMTMIFIGSNAFALCSIGGGSLYFGNMENPVGSYPQTNSYLTVNCTNEQSYTVEIDDGEHPVGTPISRQLMSENGDNLLYKLRQENGLDWGDGQTFDDVLTGIGTGSAQTHVVYGEIPWTGNLPTGYYSDITVATVKWDDGEASVNLPVTGVVMGSCTISANAVNFGRIRLPVSGPPQGQGSITVNCTPLLNYSIELNGGNNYQPPFRRMKFEENTAYLGYSLYKNTGCSEEWAIGTLGGKSGTGNGSNEVHDICGVAWPMGSEPVGLYRDDVIATISW